MQTQRILNSKSNHTTRSEHENSWLSWRPMMQSSKFFHAWALHECPGALLNEYAGCPFGQVVEGCACQALCSTSLSAALMIVAGNLSRCSTQCILCCILPATRSPCHVTHMHISLACTHRHQHNDSSTTTTPSPRKVGVLTETHAHASHTLTTHTHTHTQAGRVLCGAAGGPGHRNRGAAGHQRSSAGVL